MITTNVLLALLVFFGGASVASFALLIADRYEKYDKKRKKSLKAFIKEISVGRSKCDSCKRELDFLELFPVVNLLLIKGECKKCKHKVSLCYPLLEVGLGILFVSVYVVNLLIGMTSIHLLLSFAVLSVLFLFVLIDIKIRKVPNIFLYPVIVITLVGVIIESIIQGDYLLLVGRLVAALLGFLLFALIIYLTKGRGFGFGDAKFTVWMGLLLGKYLIIALYIAILTGAIVGLVQYFMQKRRKKKSKKKISFNKFTIPFIPFLSLGTVLMYIVGSLVWQKILELLFI